MEINILLGKVPPKKLGAPVDYYKVVHNAYTSQYLQALGIEPLERHRRVVSLRAPLQKCTIEATWADGSGVADQLRIVPPQFSSGGAKTGKTGKEQFLKDIQSDPLIRALPPDTSGIYERAKKADSSATAQEKYGVKERYLQAFLEMSIQDHKNSVGADSTLTKELEDFQNHAKGEEGPVHRREVLRQWGKDGFKELDDLKRKFILPFACETPTGIAIWRANLPQVQVPSEWVADLKRPLCVTLEQIEEEAADYAENIFPLELLSTSRDPLIFDDIRQALQSSELSRLIGLTSHLVYWNALGHLHLPEHRLPSSTRQSLVLTIQEVWSKIIDSPSIRKAGGPARGFYVPVFLLFLKWGIEQAFRSQFHKLLEEDSDHGEGIAQQLVAHINVTIMGLFDPDCAAANFGTLDSSSEAIRLWRKLHINQMKHGLTPATRTIAREFRTSPMMLLLMNSDGGPSDPKTRKLLQKSSSESVMTVVGGMPAEASGRAGSPGRQARPRLNPDRKSTLYYAACSRLSRDGSAGGRKSRKH
mmetsp:Transcript_11841/g.20218  ORF Transcript_11841/g.20218 Transcript_11841/m.20218 type:complete len:531 (-) Transcript_11841:152-1744(-)